MSYRLQRYLMMMSQSPNNSTSKLRWFNGSRLIKICGIFSGIEFGINATGRTFNDDPITIKRSHSSLSMVIESWNSADNPSPKKTISGFITDIILLSTVLSLLHFGQSGICWAKISDLMAFESTLYPQLVQVAVANDPWQVITRSIPAAFSNVSMFWE